VNSTNLARDFKEKGKELETAIWLIGPDDPIITDRRSRMLDVEWQVVSELCVVQKIDYCMYGRGSARRFRPVRMSFNAVV
jgi:hypothetical protein